MMGLVFILLLVAIAFLADKKQQVIDHEMALRRDKLSKAIRSIPQPIEQEEDSFFTLNEQNRSELLITFKDHVLFKSGEYDLKSEDAHQGLTEIGHTLHRYQKQNGKKRYHEVVVEGHTDDVPYLHHAYGNWYLSAMRANTVLDVFIDSGVDSNLLSPRGYSSTRPPFEGKRRNVSYSPEEQERMRRVDVRVRFVEDSVEVELFGE